MRIDLKNKHFYIIVLSIFSMMTILYYVTCFYFEKQLVFSEADSFILILQAIQFLIVCLMLIIIALDRQKLYNILKELYIEIESNHDEILNVSRDTQKLIIKLFRKCGEDNEKE